jgi:hypothetical protein
MCCTACAPASDSLHAGHTLSCHVASCCPTHPAYTQIGACTQGNSIAAVARMLCTKIEFDIHTPGLDTAPGSSPAEHVEASYCSPPATARCLLKTPGHVCISPPPPPRLLKVLVAMQHVVAAPRMRTHASHEHAAACWPLLEQIPDLAPMAGDSNCSSRQAPILRSLCTMQPLLYITAASEQQPE